MSAFTVEEKEILKNYFSSTSSDIFCVINLPEVIKGTLFSRYSRTAKSVRRLFLDEFYNGEISSLFKGKKEKEKKEHINTSKAEDFYERILVGYGDDSVAELGGVHIALENISNVAAKLVEDARIGISPLEKSSRYVFYDKKINGKYLYYRGKELIESKFAQEYTGCMDMLFDEYSYVVREIYQALLAEGIPDKSINEAAFKASCRAKACDIARYLLPMGTYTNVGLYGNGRAFEYLIIKLKSSPFKEAQELADKMVVELKKVIGAFIKRSTNERGVRYCQYLEKINTIFKKQKIKSAFSKSPFPTNNEVKLIYSEADALNKVIAALLFSHVSVSWKDLYKNVKSYSLQKKEQLLKNLALARENRHHKLSRGFEQAHYTFEIVSDIGAYRDVQRHRMLTQQRQSYSTHLGYTVPDELNTWPELKKRYIAAMEQAHKTYMLLAKQYPYEAQYVVPFGYRVKYYFHLNLREAVHFSELRSISQGHASYRKIAQEIARQIIKAHPLLGKYAFRFVDNKSYKLERLLAFQKIAQKAEKMGVKAFQE